MSKLEIIKIFREYKKLEILKAFLTGLIFFLLLAALFMVPVITILMLYIPYLQYFLLAIYIYLAFIGTYFIKIFVETLQTYSNPITINFKKFNINASTTLAVIIFIITFIVYIYLH